MNRNKALGLLSLALAGLGLYRFRRQFLRYWLRLSPIKENVVVQQGIRIPMPDGVELVADLYRPASERLFPTILIRTPYGRGTSAGPVGLAPAFIAQRFAERGYNVLIQDVRGRFDSKGEFVPFVHEANDGLATLRWIERQPWFNGVLGMWGPSYLGYTQWAVAGSAPLYLKALVPMISGSGLPLMGLRDRAFALDTLLRWILDLEDMEQATGWAGFRWARFLRQEGRLRRGFDHLPLAQADQQVVGHAVPFFQEWLHPTSAQVDAWRNMDCRPKLGKVTAAVHLVGGWYDILLRETLDDYQLLRQSGRQPYLTIGPWTHLDLAGTWEGLRQGLAWFDAFLKGDRRALREKPVQVYLLGADRWRELSVWPPASKPRTLFLSAAAPALEKKPGHARGGSLQPQPPSAEEAPEVYIYDPHNPTPAVGGAMMNLQAGPRDNRLLERRPDVLIYTSEPLTADLEVMGVPRLTLFVRSNRAHTDFFARLCDVYPDGRSINITDGFFRVEPGYGELQPDGTLRLELELWPTAVCFRAGHRLRLQISSGAHPRWNRNLGTGEPFAEGVTMVTAEQRVFHDAAHPSALSLPVVNSTE